MFFWERNYESFSLYMISESLNVFSLSSQRYLSSSFLSSPAFSLFWSALLICLYSQWLNFQKNVLISCDSDIYCIMRQLKLNSIQLALHGHKFVSSFILRSHFKAWSFFLFSCTKMSNQSVSNICCLRMCFSNRVRDLCTLPPLRDTARNTCKQGVCLHALVFHCLILTKVTRIYTYIFSWAISICS